MSGNIRRLRHRTSATPGSNRVLKNPNQLSPKMMWGQQRVAELRVDGIQSPRYNPAPGVQPLALATQFSLGGYAAATYLIPLDTGRFMCCYRNVGSSTTRFGVWSITDGGVVTFLQGALIGVSIGKFSMSKTGVNRWVVVSNDFDGPRVIGFEYVPGSNTITQSHASYSLPAAQNQNHQGVQGPAHSAYDPITDTVLHVQPHNYLSGRLSVGTRSLNFTQVRWDAGDSVPVVLSDYRMEDTHAPKGFSSSNMVVLSPDGTGSFHLFSQNDTSNVNDYRLVAANCTVGPALQTIAFTGYGGSSVVVTSQQGAVVYDKFLAAVGGENPVELYSESSGGVTSLVASYPDSFFTVPSPSSTRTFWLVENQGLAGSPLEVYDSSDMAIPLLTAGSYGNAFPYRTMHASPPVLTASYAWHPVSWDDYAVEFADVVQFIGEPIA